MSSSDEDDDNNDEKKPTVHEVLAKAAAANANHTGHRRRTRANPNPGPPPQAAADTAALAKSHAVLQQLHADTLDAASEDDDEVQVLDDSFCSLPGEPVPTTLLLQVEATLEDANGKTEEVTKKMSITMRSNESFHGLVENLLQQLDLPQTDVVMKSTTLRFQDKPLRLSQTPDGYNILKSDNDDDGTSTKIKSGSTLKAHVFGVLANKAAGRAKAGNAAAAASAAAQKKKKKNLGNPLRLTLRSKDGSKEEFEHREKEPFQALMVAYRTKKGLAASAKVLFQFVN